MSNKFSDYYPIIRQEENIVSRVKAIFWGDKSAEPILSSMPGRDPLAFQPWDEEELSAAVASLLEEFSMDLFFEKALEDAKRLKEEANSSRGVSGGV